MKWKETTLGSIIHIKHGYPFKSEFFSFDKGRYIVLTPGNFYENGGFLLRPEKDRYYTGTFPESFILKKNDLIVAMTEQTYGLLGSPALIPECNKYLHNQRLGLIQIKDHSEVYYKYLYYLFFTKRIREEISSGASGTKIRHTAPERIYRCKIPLPPLPIQRKIAAVLSAYDDLIDNNTRRIAILERMAEEIYREWFVRMRFPRHERVKFQKGVPEGWEIKKLGEILTLEYGKALKQDDRDDGQYPVYGSSGIVGYHSKYFCKSPGIIVGRKGNVGSIYWSNDHFYPIDTVYFVKSDYPLFYIYFLCQTMNFINNDAAVPGLNRQQAYSNSCYLPNTELINKFSDTVKPIFQIIDKISKKISALKQSRNLLLSRLMSGRLAMDDLDICFPPGMKEYDVSASSP